MASTLTRTLIDPVREKVLAGERLDFDDGVALLESDDLLGLGELADQARRLRGGGDEVYFVNNLYLNHTNVCRVKCKFCAFARTNKQDGAYTWEIGPLTQHAVKRYELDPYSEIHMVGGESPYLDLDYYLDLVRSLKAALPDVTLKCFTASEVHHMTKLSGLTHEEVLKELFAAGVETLPGGGAEVFADRVRKIVAPGKEHPDIWLEVHRLAHGMGVKTHCTMLYNHVETYEERIDHLLRLRDLQDETGGFMAFIPLPFHPENTVFERRGWTFTTRPRRPQDAGRLAPDARQHRAHQGLLDHDLDAARPGRPALRRQRHPGHGRRGDDRARRRRRHADRGEGRRPRARDPRGRARARAARLVLQRRPPLRLMLRLGRVSFINTFPVEWALARHLDPDGGARGGGRPDRAQPHAGRGRARRRQRLEHRVREQPRALRPAAVALRRLATAPSSRCSSITQLPLPAVHSVAVTSASATSVALVQRARPARARSCPEGAEADARLLIGDAALHSAFSDPTPHHDLGALWRERTGLPMVFAVWAAQRDCDPDALAASTARCAAPWPRPPSTPTWSRGRAGERHGFPAGYLARYFEKLRYGFGERERAGLERFYALAAERGAIAGTPELRFADTARVR